MNINVKKTKMKFIYKANTWSIVESKWDVQFCSINFVCYFLHILQR